MGRWPDHHSAITFAHRAQWWSRHRSRHSLAVMNQPPVQVNSHGFLLVGGDRKLKFSHTAHRCMFFLLVDGSAQSASPSTRTPSALSVKEISSSLRQLHLDTYVVCFSELHFPLESLTAHSQRDEVKPENSQCSRGNMGRNWKFNLTLQTDSDLGGNLRALKKSRSITWKKESFYYEKRSSGWNEKKWFKLRS